MKRGADTDISKSAAKKNQYKQNNINNNCCVMNMIRHKDKKKIEKKEKNEK